MKKKVCIKLSLVIVFVLLLLSGILHAAPNSPAARRIDPVVSTEWLAANHDLDNLVIIDIRSAAEYEAGHIAGSINVPFEVPFSAWITMTNDLLLELPDTNTLLSAIGSWGVKEDSLVVIVTSVPAAPEPPYPLANATRAAATLIYAGVDNVAILDGGYTKWAAEQRPVTTETPVIQPVAFAGKVKDELFVAMNYVKKHASRRQTVIIDARDADVYFGVTIEPYANKAGHIPKAKSLPTPWIWNEDGTYKSRDELAAMATGTLNVTSPQNKEIIIYCGTGGYASAWWYVMTQLLDYTNVKIYDGSAQEWVIENEMVRYTWFK
ncbi:MAG TPA: sulfurtransferase [Hydrogenispora sp.]|jgi:thiosulfate/3-mercaptopyruvate sulfurtransferase|nr:sulfurtransferase [Hydrogenispora sp.]